MSVQIASSFLGQEYGINSSLISPPEDRVVGPVPYMAIHGL